MGEGSGVGVGGGGRRLQVKVFCNNTAERAGQEGRWQAGGGRGRKVGRGVGRGGGGTAIVRERR